MVAADVNESARAATLAAESTVVSPATGAAVASEDEESKRKRRGLWAFLLLLLVAAVGIWLILSRMVTVPDVVGMTEDEAREALTEAGFVVGDIEEASPEDAEAVRPGEVAEQVPSGGSRAFKGSEIDLSLALAGDGEGGTETGGLPDSGLPSGYTGGEPFGPPEGDDEQSGYVAAVDTRPLVPSVQNMTKSQALSAIAKAGYVAVVGGYGPTTAGVLEGRVYYQNPAPYVRAARGTKVVIWISTGAPHDDGYEGVPYPGPP